LISSALAISENADIIALQEPVINKDGNTIATKDWVTIYPTTHATSPGETRSILLLRANLLTDKWKQIDIDSSDVSAVKIENVWGTLTIYNIYNDCEHDRTIDLLREITGPISNEAQNPGSVKDHVIWVGDFNRHHPLWDDPADDRLFTPEALEKAQKLIDAVSDAGLEPALPARMPTHFHNVTKRWSRLDQVFLSDHSLDSIVTCEARYSDLRIKTDHVPIITELDLTIAVTVTKDIANFREVDWSRFKEELSKRLANTTQAAEITSIQSLTEECDKLTNALQETIKDEVPVTEMGTHARRWWTKELTKLRRTAKKLGRKAHKLKNRPNDPVHGEYAEAKKRYEKEIEYCKTHHWRDWLEKAEDPDIWTAHKYISAAASDGSKSRIPTLTKAQGDSIRSAATNEEKGIMLAETFFPEGKQPDAESEKESEEAEYNQACEMDAITREQVLGHLANLKPYKAPGPDGIPNIVLTRCADIIASRLHLIYSAIVEKGMFYEPWKQFTTVVLRKPGKPKYNVPKAYRPIALLNTMVKVLTAILAEQLMYYAEQHKMLPPNHFGGRKCRTATDAVHLLVNNIKDAWRKGKVTAVLFLDIEGAFPNADNKQLAKNLKRRGVPNQLVDFISEMLKDRSTILKFDDYVSEPILLNNGIGQGDPLSMALYQFYNADILDIPTGKDESAIAYVDDAILTATASTFQQAHKILTDMMTRQGGAIEWTRTHNSQFEYSKLALVDFAHYSKKVTRPPLTLPSITINPSKSTKYLGIILDQCLNWKEQLAYVIGKGAKWTAQISRVTRPSWGLTPGAARRVYQGVAIPRILYGIEVWCTPKQQTPRGKVTQGPPAAIAKLATTQRAGALAITGGFRTSPSDSLDAHAALLPMHLKIGRQQHNAALRMASLPPSHPLHNSFRKAFNRQPKRHKSPLHYLATCIEVPPDEIEELQEELPVVRINPAQRHDLPVSITIPENKEASTQIEARATETIRVFTDGSSHNGKVGAAAVLQRPGKPDRTLKVHLGEASHHTVYEAELAGILLGLHLIKNERRSRVKCIIGADNQAAVQALRTDLTGPGQHIAAECRKLAKLINKTKRSRNFKLTIRWTAGHSGIPGNEKADKEAKDAAGGASSNAADLPRYLRKPVKKSISALKQKHNDKAKEAWKEEWQKSERYKRFRAPDIVTPYSKKFIKLISNNRISRNTASLIYQLRVGHAPLNDYLHRFHKVDSPRCPACGASKETVEHLIKHCPGYAHERWLLMREFKASDPKLEEILSEPKAITQLSKYLTDTGRFKLA
jgi:ribonuclease HI